MRDLTEGLPSEIVARLHPDLMSNERAYRMVRDELLASHRGRWVAYADGEVVAEGTSPVAVYHAAAETGLHPFITRVGFEDEPCRIRQRTFRYDDTYGGEPLPVVELEFRKSRSGPGLVLDRVIADTGADATALPWRDSAELECDPSEGTYGRIEGVGDQSMPTIGFAGWVRIDGHPYPCRIQADFTGSDRILGRDVLNALDVLFRSPLGEVVFRPELDA